MNRNKFDWTHASIRPAIWGVLVGATSLCSAEQPFFHALPPLPSHSQTLAFGISANGLVVVGNSGVGDSLPVMWRVFEYDPIVLGDLPGGTGHGQAYAASCDGSVIVGWSNATGFVQVPFRWSDPEVGGHGMEALGPLPPGFPEGQAYGVNCDGSVVVGSVEASGPDELAFRWSADSGFVHLQDLAGGASTSVARDVAADGSVVCGNSTTKTGSEAVLWPEFSGIEPLGTLIEGGFSWGLAMTSDGNIVVGWGSSSEGPRAYRWTDPATGGPGMENLGVLPGKFEASWALGVSDDGSTVVGFCYYLPEGPFERDLVTAAFVWTPRTGMVAVADVLTTKLGVDLRGFELNACLAVSADGRMLAGNGKTAVGQDRAWVANLGAFADPTDLNGDGDVDGLDLALLLGAWGPCPGCPADLDGNGIVNGFDLALLLAAWS